MLAPAQKLETRTSYLYQKDKYQVEEISHMPIQYVTIAPAKMTPIAPEYQLLAKSFLSPQTQVPLIQPYWRRKLFSTEPFQPLVLYLFAQIANNIFFTHP